MAFTMENWNHSILYRLGFKHDYEQIEVKNGWRWLDKLRLF